MCVINGELDNCIDNLNILKKSAKLMFVIVQIKGRFLYGVTELLTLIFRKCT